MSSKVLVEGVTKIFYQRGRGGVHALKDVDLAVDPGEFLCVAGPSGCGKTTLLNMIAGLDTPDEGRIFVGGSRVHGPSPERTVVFQDGALFPWLTCGKNVEYGLRMRGELSKGERKDRAEEALASMGLDSMAERYPHEVSGGQRQRVAIARALVMEPEVLLCDEPFAALDALTRKRLAVDMARLWETTRMTVIWVEHNLYLPALLADRVLLLAADPGRVLDEVVVRLPRPRSPSDLGVIKVGDWLSDWLEALDGVRQGHRVSLPAPPDGAEVRPAPHHGRMFH
ncbi:ABC transporter ATP-binding protein [Vulgatibacter incomptus]|uniref:ABC-type nitrate/sulfonate/bicarbonate transport system, ATPase component n=1 Tax=Vulgatibacter incomptus TaxID=1391653 RepID=A0A0K1PD09_9BACT|nr:ABC transporter ATP-binding protein [Vulgatibacter incomptus]AKU91387.1 ABC-type nitrate/sulfonate/bicarbonate transport system, ATPase component [Vulgatibacter incomptus]